MLRTSRTCSSTVSTLHSPVSTGGSTWISTVAGRNTKSPRGATSPALRITMGTMGTPACIARWNAPFLKGAIFGDTVRVPSGASTTERPSLRMASTSGAMASMALPALALSMNTTPPISSTLPRMGVSDLISCLPTPAISLRSNLATMMTSALLWWLKMNTAGRRAHRFSSPVTLSFIPIRALAVSANREKEKFSDSRLEPVRA